MERKVTVRQTGQTQLLLSKPTITLWEGGEGYLNNTTLRLPFSPLPHSYTHNGDGSPKSYRLLLIQKFRFLIVLYTDSSLMCIGNCLRFVVAIPLIMKISSL